MGARPSAGAGDTAMDRQACSCLRGAGSPGGETGFNDDSHNHHLNTTNGEPHKRDTRWPEGNDEDDLVWCPGRARADQAEGTELWNPRRLEGHWRKRRAVGVKSIERS